MGLVAVTRDYEHYKDIYRPNVAQSKVISIVLLMNRSVVSKTALDTEYLTSYSRVDMHRSYTVTDATRIREIAGFGGESQHELPEDTGTGLMETEVVVLNRDIPPGLR